VFRDNQVTEERIMDSNDLERERGASAALLPALRLR